MAIQRTFEVSHLKQYLQSADGIHKMFEQLGYEVFDPEPFEAEDLEMSSETDTSNVRAFYTVGSLTTHTSHNIWLFEVEDTTALRLRGIAYELLARLETHTIVVTKDYKEVIFVHPYSVGNLTKSNTRVNKLKIDVKNPTRHDVDTINALLARGREPDEIYKAQDDAFNVTKVTNKFYKEYRDYFEAVKNTVVDWNKGIPEFQNSDQRDKLHAFVQRLMGRMMFLYFLQRKGWLGGDSNFMTTQYRQMLNRHKGDLSEKDTYYYREVLEPLFFETLNKKRDDNWTNFDLSGRKGKARIPYLNGGLFDQSRDPEGIILLPDSLFDPNNNRGLLAFFNRYNFTIADDTPLEQDVAVDPEMLGKVFENMLEEEDRGQSGSFYTPRTIVSYMCQESLAGYLEESANIPREHTRQHFNPDADVQFTAEQAQAVSEALDTLTVLDPAVGSGSFLIGMMTEIITLRKKTAEALAQDVNTDLIADWKEQIIRDTLYGVDIKAGAIEIAQLRLWLALIVNQTMENAHPLPNLDYKLMAGNSLIETIDGQPILTENAIAKLNAGVQARQRGLFDRVEDKNVVKLAELRKEYFTASPQRRKQLAEDIRYRERKVIETGLDDMLENAQDGIANLENKYKGFEQGNWSKRDANKYKDLITKEDRITTIKTDLWNDEATLPFFLYRLHFNDVFDTEKGKGGFDVVVANPPYVRGDLLKDQKPELKASYPQVYTGTADLYVYFFANSYNLLKNNGQIAFITSNKFKIAKYAKKLREFLASTNILQLIDFGELPVFKEAATDPIITIGSFSNWIQPPIFVQVQDWVEQGFNLRDYTLEKGYSLPKDAIVKSNWTLANKKTIQFITKLDEIGIRLEDYTNGEIYRGLITGFNDAFVIDDMKRQELIEIDINSQDFIEPYLRGRDVFRWHTKWNNLYIIVIPNSNDIGINHSWSGKDMYDGELQFSQDYPALHEHLKFYENNLINRHDQGQYWWELRACTYYDKFKEPKIIYPNICTHSKFMFDTTSFYINQKCYVIPKDDMFLLGILNSSAMWEYLKFNSSPLGDPNKGGRLELSYVYMKNAPIPDVSNELRREIARLTQQCLDVAQENPEQLPALEAELNQLVYQAYGLDEDDIEVIEKHLEG